MKSRTTAACETREREAAGSRRGTFVTDGSYVRESSGAWRSSLDQPIITMDECGISSSGKSPSLILILSDIKMPGMSGIEMLPKVRAQRPNVPAIMITACGDEDTKRHAIAQGAVGLLTKPIDFALLRQEIESRLDQAA